MFFNLGAPGHACRLAVQEMPGIVVALREPVNIAAHNNVVDQKAIRPDLIVKPSENRSLIACRLRFTGTAKSYLAHYASIN